MKTNTDMNIDLGFQLIGMCRCCDAGLNVIFRIEINQGIQEKTNRKLKYELKLV
jgi:hypothetical protein